MSILAVLPSTQVGPMNLRYRFFGVGLLLFLAPPLSIPVEAHTVTTAAAQSGTATSQTGKAAPHIGKAELQTEQAAPHIGKAELQTEQAAPHTGQVAPHPGKAAIQTQRAEAQGEGTEAETEEGRSVPGAGSEGILLSRWAEEYLRLAKAAEVPNLEGHPDRRWRLERIRAMYFLSVENNDWIDSLADSLEAVARDLPPGSRESVILEGYRASLDVVRAKHARWPPNKLKHLRRGSESLDRQVEGHPHRMELRYLRYASYRFLPFFLSRDETVEADRDALVDGFTQRPDDLSPTLFGGMVQFLLDHAQMDPSERVRLQQALRASEEDRSLQLSPDVRK